MRSPTHEASKTGFKTLSLTLAFARAPPWERACCVVETVSASSTMLGSTTSILLALVLGLPQLTQPRIHNSRLHERPGNARRSSSRRPAYIKSVANEGPEYRSPRPSRKGQAGFLQGKGSLPVIKQTLPRGRCCCIPQIGYFSLVAFVYDMKRAGAPATVVFLM
jgi:hypothetical protein